MPSGRLLSAESIDLALALTTAFRATDADGGRQRSDAVAVAVAGVIEHVLGSGRDHADAAVLLAAIGDATERLQALAPVDEGSNLATQDLLAALAVPPIISRHTPPGAVARTAWALAAARASGTAAYDPSLLAAHPDPSMDAALRDRIDAWWRDPCPVAKQPGDLQALEQRFRGHDDEDQRLRAGEPGARDRLDGLSVPRRCRSHGGSAIVAASAP